MSDLVIDTDVCKIINIDTFAYKIINTVRVVVEFDVPVGNAQNFIDILREQMGEQIS